MTFLCLSFALGILRLNGNRETTWPCCLFYARAFLRIIFAKCFLHQIFQVFLKMKPQIVLPNRYQQIMFVSGLGASSPPNSLSKYLPLGLAFSWSVDYKMLYTTKYFRLPFWYLAVSCGSCILHFCSGQATPSWPSLTLPFPIISPAFCFYDAI